MITIYVYGVEATFGGSPEFEWSSPTTGARHKAILFLAQDADHSQTERAKLELARFGFVDIEVGSGRPIHVESLNDPEMSTFRKHYEGAIEEGCSLVWYPQNL